MNDEAEWPPGGVGIHVVRDKVKDYYLKQILQTNGKP